MTVLLTIIVIALFSGGSTDFLFPQAYGDPTTIEIDPTASTAYVNETFSVNITIIDVANLTGWEIRLYYNNTLLNCTAFTEGPFLQSAGSTFKVVDILNDFNSTHGRILAACSLLGLNVSANGSGVIATAAFKALAQGATPLDLENTKLSDEKIPPQPIIHTVVDGTVNVTLPPEQVVDVYTQRGGIGANVSSDAFAPEETILFNASVRYQGSPVPGTLVLFITYDANGDPTARTTATGQDGIATSNITLSSSPVFGIYTTIASASVQGFNYSDAVTFKVGRIESIYNASSCNSQGTPQTSFPRGTPAYFNITLENISFNPKQLFLWIDVKDSANTPAASEWIHFTTPSGKATLMIGFRIPSWSIPGEAGVVINGYPAPPVPGVVAYFPTYYSNMTIAGS